MTEFWEQFEGLNVGGYILRKRRHAAGKSAYFDAESETNGVVVRLEAGEGAGARLELWRRIAGLCHPHLLRMMDAGWATGGGTRVAYAVFERPDEILGQVLEGRALSAEETRQALLAASEALAYIHGEGLVHGEVGVWSIAAAGNAIKLPCDGLRPATTDRPAAADMRALGLAACEMLTRRVPAISGGRPQWTAEEARAAAPFEKFIRNCLAEGEGRWSAASAVAFLRGEAEDGGQEAGTVASTARPEPAGGLRRRRAGRAWWWGVAAAVCATVVFFGTRGGTREVRQEAERATGEAVASSKPALPEGKERAARRELPAPARAWRVIVYTYGGLDAAERKAQSINRRWPEFRAEVFALEQGRGPYLVSLKGRMTREEALRVQRAARAEGLPRDTFIQNYSR
jgi:hypothetical protein